MKNLSDIRTSNEFKVGETYTESNGYYRNCCVSKGTFFTADYGMEYQEIVFNVTTKTGRILGEETRKFPTK